MLSSENKYQISISFNQRIEGILLTLVDGTLETVYSGNTEQLNLELPEGIYKLIAKFIDFTQEYPLIIDENKNILLDFNYPSVAPILSFVTTHEYFHVNSEQYSKFTTEKEAKGNPSFLFFAAKYDKDKFQKVIMGNLLVNYSIINSENQLLWQFDSENSKYSDDYGWLAFSNKLQNGQYFLKWNNESECRIFPFYIFDNYQTQFFIRYSTKPDFENCFFFYSNKMCFNIDAEEYLVLDKILFAFKDYSNYKLLSEKDCLILKQHPFLITLVYILQLSLNLKELDFLISDKLLLPDLILVSESKEKSHSQDLLPIISSVMCKYAVRKKNDTLTFNPASIIDRTIDHLKFDIFWNNFSKIDDVNDWNDIYNPLLQKSKLFTINKNDNRFTKLGKVVFNLVGNASKETIQERFNSLVGNLQTEDIEAKVNDTINSIGDVSEISEKLNLPPTKVLRNYKTYKGIYDKLK